MSHVQGEWEVQNLYMIYGLYSLAEISIAQYFSNQIVVDVTNLHDHCSPLLLNLRASLLVICDVC